LGFAEANNFAMVNGGLETEYVCFLNQDTLSVEGWLDACVQCLASNSEIGALTPLVTTYDGQGWDPNFKECAYFSGDFRDNWEQNIALEELYKVPRIPAAAMIARTEVINEVGPFDPIFGSYCEDYDLCDRIRNAGHAIGICTYARLKHFSGSARMSRSWLRQKARQGIRNRIILGSRQRAGDRAAWVLNQITLVMVRRIARAFFGRKGSQPLSSVLMAWFDALVLLPRLMSSYTDTNAFQRDLTKIGWFSKAKRLIAINEA
jgi:GT2 family glycosyltransferase